MNSPINAGWAHPHIGKTGIDAYTANAANNVLMNPATLAATGGNQPHNNMPPYQVLMFIIALQGIFPSRS
jgi:microcystin-dependent protein